MASRGQFYQLSLIVLFIVATVLYGAFFMREVNPEYRQFQQTYETLEEFRSEITREPPAPFRRGVKQLVLVQEDNGPEVIDRCTTCHVALEFSHFSPTKIAEDVNGNVILDSEGIPVKVANENYVWGLVDEKIAELRDDSVIAQLESQGDSSQIAERLSEAQTLESLKVGHVGHNEVDMTQVLAMHPLMGKETRPFEFHPIEEYGCTSCHGGNGRALTVEKAHGPVFDGQYHEAYEGPRPEFLELDPDNDPMFSRVFNHKPGHGLLFQTTPIMVGGLIQSNCVQCHLNASKRVENTVGTVEQFVQQSGMRRKNVGQSLTQEITAVASLIDMRRQLSQAGFDALVKELDARTKDYKLPAEQRKNAEGQIAYLQGITKGLQGHDRQKVAEAAIEAELIESLGSEAAIAFVEAKIMQDPAAFEKELLTSAKEPTGFSGRLLDKANAFRKTAALSKETSKVNRALQDTVSLELTEAISSDVDNMLSVYQLGKELYFAQACYACHRISGLARGGVGPELTTEGLYYPWFIKESIVWPQADLHTSTMPNFHLDHEELEALTTYLLSLKGKPKAVSDIEHQVAIKAWEEGRKLPYEAPVEPTQIHDLHYGMTVFATEGCAACHRLKGFQSNVGFAIERNGEPSFDKLYKEQRWFEELIPENISGSELVSIIDSNAEEIDRRIVNGIREGAILEELEQTNPGILESYYSPFKYAFRAKNAALASAENGSELLEEYQERVQRVLMMYVQEYGLGRLVGPRISWSGIYRSDQWLIEHFYNPSAHAARSIMPVFPFDETKFQALTYTLDMLAKQNTHKVRQIWDTQGFNPELAFDIHCSQCHGNFREGNGPVAQWLYPIPKSLRNAGFLRGLTKDRVHESIVHGVRGGPMPPWGELASDKPFVNDTPVLTDNEVSQLVDWLFLTLPKGGGIGGEDDPRKWQYRPEDVLEELQNAGDVLKNGVSALQQQDELELLLSVIPSGSEFYADLEPKVAVSASPTGQGVEDIFDIRNNPIPGVERKAYYVKKEFYTPQNLAEGEAFFVENCAICHGKEGAGTGLRAATMIEAKPRMLTNLDWLETRDDLRLLQSIKYGVVGTAMTPWGDFTSSLQRLQLVMYIRSLSREGVLRDHIQETLYSTFDKAITVVRELQIPQYEIMEKLEKQVEAARNEKRDLSDRIATEPNLAQQAVEVYQRELALEEKLQRQQSINEALDTLIREIRREKSVYDALGAGMLTSLGDDPLLDDCLSVIQASSNRYSIRDNTLTVDTPEQDPLRQGNECVISKLGSKIEALEEERQRLQGRIPSAERTELLAEVEYRLKGYRDFQNQLVASLEEARRSHQLQKELVARANKGIEQAATTSAKETSWRRNHNRRSAA